MSEFTHSQKRQAYLEGTDEEKAILLRDFPEVAYSEDQIKQAFAEATPEELEVLKRDFPEYGSAGVGRVVLNTLPGALAATLESAGGMLEAIEDISTGTEYGKKIAEEARWAGLGLADEMALRPDVDWGDYAKNILYSGATSAAQQAPLIAAAGLGSISPLTAATAMGVLSGTAEYSEAKRQGYDPFMSAVKGTLYGAAEGLGEKVGIDTLLAKTGLTPKALAAKLVKYIAAEEVSEVSTEAMQYATDVLAQAMADNKEAQIDELWPRIKDTFMSTLVAAPLLGGVGIGAQYYDAKRRGEETLTVPDSEQTQVPDYIYDDELGEIVEQAEAENAPPQNQQQTTNFLQGKIDVPPEINSMMQARYQSEHDRVEHPSPTDWLTKMGETIQAMTQATNEQKGMAEEAINIIMGYPADPRLERINPEYQTAQRPQMITPDIPTPTTSQENNALDKLFNSGNVEEKEEQPKYDYDKSKFVTEYPTGGTFTEDDAKKYINKDNGQPIHANTVSKLNEAFDNRDVDRLLELLHPGNKLSRKMVADKFGVKFGNMNDNRAMLTDLLKRLDTTEAPTALSTNPPDSELNDEEWEFSYENTKDYAKSLEEDELASRKEIVVEAEVAKTLTDHIYDQIKAGNDFADKTTLKRFAKEKGFENEDTRPVYEAYEAAKVREAQEVYNQFKDKPDELINKFIDFNDRQLSNARRTDTVNDLQQFSTPVNISALGNLILDRIGATIVLEPTAGNGGLLLNGERKAIVNELDSARFDNVKRLPNVVEAFNHNVLDKHSMMDITAAANSAGVDSVIANPPFGIGETKSGEPREFKIIKDSLNKTGVDKGVFVIADAHPFTLTPSKKEPHLTRIGARVFEANNTGRVADYEITKKQEYGPTKELIYYLKNIETGEEIAVLERVLNGRRENGNRFFIDTPVSRKMDDFFKWLYGNYNVVLNEPIAGAEYSKGGTKYPTRLIAINGRGPTAYKTENIERRNKTVREIYDNIKGVDFNANQERTDGGPETGDSGRGELENVDRTGNNADTTNSPATNSTASKPRGGSGGVSTKVGGKNEIHSDNTTEQTNNNTDGTQPAERPDVLRNDGKTEIQGNDERDGGIPNKGEQSAADPLPDELDGGRTKQESSNENEQLEKSNERGTVPRNTPTADVNTLLENSITPYEPKSDNTVYGGLKVPSNIYNETNEATNKLKNRLAENGYTFTSYVAEKTGIKENLMTREKNPVLTAEQVETVALTIDNIENGEQTIIGHDTGTGKGRIGAAVLSYSVKTLKKTPIFFSVKPTLATDILRDLMDIHDFGADPNARVEDFLKEFKILSINELTGNRTGEDGKKVLVYNPLDRTVALPSPPKVSAKTLTYERLKNIMDNGKYNVIFMTYSQFQEFRDTDTRYLSVAPLLEDGLLVLDEAHKAAGVLDEKAEEVAEDHSNYINDKGKKTSNTSLTFFDIAGLIDRAKAPVLLSATFSKRANTLPIYLWKDRLKFGLKEQMFSVIESLKGGQATAIEYITKALTKLGKYLRMEKDYEGVDVFSEKIKYDNPDKVKTVIDDVAKVFQTISTLDRDIKEALPESKRSGAINLEGMGFSSVMHNYLNQLMFAVRTDAISKKAADLIKQGRKVVIAFENTMESIADDLYGAPKGERINNDLSHIFLNILNKHILTRKVSDRENHPTDPKKTVKGNTFEIRIGRATINADGYIDITIDINDPNPTIQELKEQMLYTVLREDEKGNEITLNSTIEEMREFLKSKKFGYSISPIDALKRSLIEYLGEGYRNKIGEITGRSFEIDENDIYKVRTPENANAVINKFNGGSVTNPVPREFAYDIVLLNRSGSTGISLHNDPRFGTALYAEDGVRRAMLIAQPLSDPNEIMQMLGRVHRFGQLTAPEYYLLDTGIPAETRMQAALISKLKSLNASVSADRSGGQISFEGADVFNVVGDEVMNDFLEENPEYAAYMGLKVKYDATKGVYSLGEEGEALAQRVFGKLAALTTRQQHDFLNDFMYKYNATIDNLNMLGTNPLVSATLKLDAETLDELVVKPATDNTPFGAEVVRKIIMANNITKPVQIAELEKEAPTNKALATERYEKGLAKAQEHLEYLDIQQQVTKDPVRAKQKKEMYDRHREKIDKLNETLSHLIDNIGKLVRVEYRIKKEGDPQKTKAFGRTSGFLVDVAIAPIVASPYTEGLQEKPLTFLDRNITLKIYENNEGLKTFKLDALVSRVETENESFVLSRDHQRWDENIQRDRREVRVFLTGNMLKLSEYFSDSPQGVITKINTKDDKVEYGFLINKKATEINSNNWQEYAAKERKHYLNEAKKGKDHHLKMPSKKPKDPQRIYEGRVNERTFTETLEPRDTTPGPYEVKVGKYLASLNRLEIVRLAEALGSIPEVWKRLRRGVLGSFNDGTGKIKISAAALTNENIEAVTTAIAHEIGHLIDWKEGSVDETLTRGNILGHIGILSRFMKHTLNLDPAGQPPYMSKKERAKIYYKARKEATDPTTGIVDYAIYRERYTEMVSDYLDDNDLIHKEVLIGELTALTQHFLNISNEDLINDYKFWEYATSAEELYANAMGAFLINPAMLGENAPNAAEMLYNYMREKPATLRLYQYLQNKIAGGDRYADNLKYLRKKMMEADARQSKFLASKNDKAGLIENIKTSLIDRLTPLLKYANAADRDEDSFKMLSEAQRLRSANDIIEAYLKSFLPKVNDIIKKFNIDITDLGLKAYFTRVIEERSKIGVIDLTDEKLADRLNKELDKSYTAEQIMAMTKIFDILHEARRPLIEKLVTMGLYNKTLADKLLDNNSYFTFDITEHLDKALGSNNSIAQRIHKQYGTLKLTANPFVSTILKDIALTRLAIEMSFTKQALSFLRGKGVTVTKAKKDSNGKPLPPPLKSGLGMVEVLFDSKAEGYYIPADIAKAINENTFEAGAGLQAVAAINNLSRFTFTSGNPAFIISNAFRDVQGSFLKTPYVLENFGTWTAKMLKAFWQAITNKEDQKVVNEMLGRGLLYGERSMNYQPDADLTTWDNILRKYKIANYEDFNAQNAPMYLKVVNFFSAIGEYLASPILNMSARIEKASKIGSYNFLREIKDKHDLSEAEIDYIISEFAGTPNGKRKGKLTPYTNNIFLFSNIWAQGFKSHIDAAKYSPYEYFGKMASLAAAPVVLTWILSYFDDDGWWAKINEYYKSSYHIIPLHWFGGPKFDKNGKPIFLTLPKEEMQRSIGASLWKALNSLKEGEVSKGFMQIFDVWSGDVPKLAPMFNAVVAVQQYASGKNPYDYFRGRHVIDPLTFEAQDFDTDKAFMLHLANLFGLNVLYKADPAYRKRVGEKPSSLESVSKTPYYGLNVPGRFLHVDDSGEQQEIAELTSESKAKNARELKLVNSYLEKINDNKMNDITDEEREAKNKHLEYFRRQRERIKNPNASRIKAAPKDIRQQVRDILK